MTNANKQTHIHIIEDTDDVYLLLSIFLRPFPIQLTRSRTGEEGIKFCRSNNEVKLVLMDIRLPGIDGYTATRKIKSFKPDLPIIAQTAYAQTEDRLQALNAGCNDYLPKPISKDQLLKTIRQYINF